METWKKRALELAGALMLGEKKNPAVISSAPRKTALARAECADLPRTTPAAAGMSALALTGLMRALEEEGRAHVHNLMIVREGKVVCEASAPGYDRHLFHLSHSMSKTVTGMAIGLLMGEGKIDIQTRVCTLFPECVPKDKRLLSLTVGHLLSMQSGVGFAEAGAVSETEWTRAYFESSLAFAPGEDYAYNSMNSYILSRAVHRVSGENLSDYLAPRLFAPLGISDFFWETGPEDDQMGGWGLYLSCESWAKLGLLMMRGGVWEGKEILPAEYVSAAVCTHAQTPPENGDFNYGYHLWVSRDDTDFLFNGMLGQNVWVCPRRGVVAVLQCGNNELFSQSPALTILRRALTDASAYEPDGWHARREMIRQQACFFERRTWILPPRVPVGAGGRRRGAAGFAPVYGTYAFRENNTGLLPFFVRVMQNNYTGGLRKLHLGPSVKGGCILLTVTEGERDFALRVGLYAMEENILSVGGEVYRVRAIGAAGEDEDRHPLWKILLCFPELPNVRHIKLSFTEEGTLLLRMSEIPNEQIATNFFEGALTGGSVFSLLVGAVDKREKDGFLRRKLADAFAPALIGVRESDPRLLDVLERENEKSAAQRRSYGFILNRLMRLSGEDAPATDAPATRRSIFDLFRRS